MPVAMSAFCLAKLHRGSVPIVVSLLGVGLELSGIDVGLSLAKMVLPTEVLSGSN